MGAQPVGRDLFSGFLNKAKGSRKTRLPIIHLKTGAKRLCYYLLFTIHYSLFTNHYSPSERSERHERCRPAHWLRLVPALFYAQLTFLCFARLLYCTIFTLFYFHAFAGALPLHPARFLKKAGQKLPAVLLFNLYKDSLRFSHAVNDTLLADLHINCIRNDH